MCLTGSAAASSEIIVSHQQELTRQHAQMQQSVRDTATQMQEPTVAGLLPDGADLLDRVVLTGALHAHLSAENRMRLLMTVVAWVHRGGGDSA